MKKFVLLISFLFIIPQSAFAHALLMDSVPTSDAVLDSPPEMVTLSFLGYVEHFFSKISVFDSGGNKVSDKTKFVDGDEGTVMKSGFSEELASGEYLVQWKCLGKDGHKQKGSYKFTIK